MAGFASQPDEGYSEDPLNALPTSTSPKYRNDAVSALASALSDRDFPSWLTQHISNLPDSRKTGMSANLALLRRFVITGALRLCRVFAQEPCPVHSGAVDLFSSLASTQP